MRHSMRLRMLSFQWKLFMLEKIEKQLKKVLYTYFQMVFSISGFIISSFILSLKTKSDFFANGKIKAEISFAGNLFGTCSLFIYMYYHCVKTQKYLIFNTCYIILVSKFYRWEDSYIDNGNGCWWHVWDDRFLALPPDNHHPWKDTNITLSPSSLRLK